MLLQRQFDLLVQSNHDKYDFDSVEGCFNIVSSIHT